MKKIGFVDFYLSEWHANNYPGWIAKMNEAAGTDYEVAYAWAEQDISPVDGVNSAQWCEKFGASLCTSLEELCEKSDVIIILAPSNPEKHLGYAKVVLPYGKRTYIDKTFAPNLEEAKEIFAIAEKYNTPFFSTSALRYADELKVYGEADNLIITGAGRTFEEYSIHLVEMAVSLLESPVKQVKAEYQGDHRFCFLTAENGKSATLIYAPSLPYSINGDLPNGENMHRAITSDFFKTLMAEILHFFETGVLPFDAKQTLEAMRMRDALLNAPCGEWITVD